MKEFSADVRIYGTVYIKAESEEEAQEKLLDLDLDCVFISGTDNPRDGIIWAENATVRLDDDAEVEEAD